MRRLAKAATLMSSRLNVPEVKEEGSNELRAAVRAFNKMNRRIDSYIQDRDMLFGSISHDLKTPIACLKLRAEMLDDDRDRERFSRLANDLDLMVKGALQCIRETDIHEDVEPIDINQMLHHITENLPYKQEQVVIYGQAVQPFIGKPLAMKRCLQNLIDNAVKYGTCAKINIEDGDKALILTITDEGNGLTADVLEKLCAPYFRADSTQEGNGLGLTISQSIAKAHGGHLQLSLTSNGGLNASLIFPRG